MRRSPTQPSSARPSTRRRRPPRATVPWHRRLKHRPSIAVPWVVAGALAALAGLTVGRVAALANDARTQWGDTRSVLVARGPVEVGDRLAGSVDRVERPLVAIPDAALTRLPAGARADRPLTAGEVLVPSTIRASAAGGGESDPGRRVIAVVQPDARLRLRIGDRVDVWSTLDPSIAGENRPSTIRATEGAAVVDVRDSTVSLAVDMDDLPAVAEASALGAVTVVGVPEGAPG